MIHRPGSANEWTCEGCPKGMVETERKTGNGRTPQRETYYVCAERGFGIGCPDNMGWKNNVRYRKKWKLGKMEIG